MLVQKTIYMYLTLGMQCLIWFYLKHGFVKMIGRTKSIRQWERWSVFVNDLYILNCILLQDSLGGSIGCIVCLKKCSSLLWVIAHHVYLFPRTRIWVGSIIWSSVHLQLKISSPWTEISCISKVIKIWETSFLSLPSFSLSFHTFSVRACIFSLTAAFNTAIMHLRAVPYEFSIETYFVCSEADIMNYIFGKLDTGII